MATNMKFLLLAVVVSVTLLVVLVAALMRGLKGFVFVRRALGWPFNSACCWRSSID